jgi:hypothetical protein
MGVSLDACSTGDPLPLSRKANRQRDVAGEWPSEVRIPQAIEPRDLAPG